MFKKYNLLYIIVFSICFTSPSFACNPWGQPTLKQTFDTLICNEAAQPVADLNETKLRLKSLSRTPGVLEYGKKNAPFPPADSLKISEILYRIDPGYLQHVGFDLKVAKTKLGEWFHFGKRYRVKKIDFDYIDRAANELRFSEYFNRFNQKNFKVTPDFFGVMFHENAFYFVYDVWDGFYSPQAFSDTSGLLNLGIFNYDDFFHHGVMLINMVRLCHSKDILIGNLKPDYLMFKGLFVGFIDFSAFSLISENSTGRAYTASAYSNPKLDRIENDLYALAIILLERRTASSIFELYKEAFENYVDRESLDEAERHMFSDVKSIFKPKTEEQSYRALKILRRITNHEEKFARSIESLNNPMLLFSRHEIEFFIKGISTSDETRFKDIEDFYDAFLNSIVLPSVAELSSEFGLVVKVDGDDDMSPRSTPAHSEADEERD